MDNHENELVHWGIKGMQWGRRRYQTKDGKLTPAGRKRYAEDVAKAKAKNEKLAAKVKAKKAQDRAQARVDKLLEEQKAMKLELKGKKAADGEAKVNALIGKSAKKAEAEQAKAEAKARKETEIEDAVNNKVDEAKKQKILRSQDPEKILKNAHLFNEQELNTAVTRLQAESKIKGMIPEKLTKGQEMLNKTADASKKIGEIANNTVAIYDKAAGLVNALPQSIRNRIGLGNTELPTVSGYENWAKRRGEAAKAAAEESARNARAARAADVDGMTRDDFFRRRGAGETFTADEVKRLKSRWKDEDEARKEALKAPKVTTNRYRRLRTMKMRGMTIHDIATATGLTDAQVKEILYGET